MVREQVNRRLRRAARAEYSKDAGATPAQAGERPRTQEDDGYRRRPDASGGVGLLRLRRLGVLVVLLDVKELEDAVPVELGGDGDGCHSAREHLQDHAAAAGIEIGEYAHC